MKIAVPLISLLLSTSVIDADSCIPGSSGSGQQPGDNDDRDFYRAFGDKLSEDLDEFADVVRGTDASESLRDELIAKSKLRFAHDSDAQQAFVGSLQAKKEDSDPNAQCKRERDIVDQLVQSADSASQALGLLEQEFERIYASSALSREDRHFMLVYITTTESYILALMDHQDLFNRNFVPLDSSLYSSAWKSWGKCAAGTIAGAGGAAMEGCGLGAGALAVGCAAGAVAGGFFGGLGGAAASC